MRSAHGRWWVVTQFFAVSIAQHGMLVCTVPCPPPTPRCFKPQPIFLHLLCPPFGVNGPPLVSRTLFCIPSAGHAVIRYNNYHYCESVIILNEKYLKSMQRAADPSPGRWA